jgi:hypothetical protein
MNFRKTNRRSKERGIAMILAMTAIVLLAIIGLGFMFMADTENSVNNSYKDAQKAYFASRAGLENVRLLLIPPDPKTGLGAGPLWNQAAALQMPAAAYPLGGTGVLYVLNPAPGDNIDPTLASGNTAVLNPMLDNEICQEQFVNLVGYQTVTRGAPCDANAQPAELPTTNYFAPAAVPAGAIINSGTNSALSFKWVRITNKQNYMGTLNRLVDPAQPAFPGGQVCWDGSTQRVIPPGNSCFLTASPSTNSMMPVWLLTSLSVRPAFGQNPGSRRITQMEIAASPPLVPNAPIATQAPVTLQGSYILNSYDNCTCKCTTSGSGSNATTTCTNLNGTACYNQAYAVETAGTVGTIGSSGQTISGQPSPYQQNVNPWPFDIDGLINNYKQNAQSPSWGSSCTGTINFTAIPPQYLNCGTQTSQQFGTYPSGLPTEPAAGSYTSVTEYIPGSVKLTSAATGSGILIVDGDLEVNGGLNWYGLILVRGKVSFTGGAGQSVNLYGSILAGEDVLAVNNTESDTFGGSINFHYDVCALKQSGAQVPPRILTTHEITF